MNGRENGKTGSESLIDMCTDRLVGQAEKYGSDKHGKIDEAVTGRVLRQDITNLNRLVRQDW